MTRPLAERFLDTEVRTDSDVAFIGGELGPDPSALRQNQFTEGDGRCSQSEPREASGVASQTEMGDASAPVAAAQRLGSAMLV